MKKKLKLTDVTKHELSKNELISIKGGYVALICFCRSACTCSGNSYQSAQRSSLHSGKKAN